AGAIGDRVHRQRTPAPVRFSTDDRAPFLVVIVGTPGRLDEGAGIDRPTRCRSGNPDAVVIFAAVVESRERSRNHLGGLLVFEEFETATEVSKRLIVDPHDRLKAEQTDRLVDVLEVVRLAGRHARKVRRGPPVEDVEAGLVETILRNASEHAAVGKTSGLSGLIAGPWQQWILDVGIGIPEIVGGLGKVSLTFKCGGQ